MRCKLPFLPQRQWQVSSSVACEPCNHNPLVPNTTERSEDPSGDCFSGKVPAFLPTLGGCAQRRRGDPAR
jgi:hypothetical protein